MASLNEALSTNASVIDSFLCNICLEILVKPVQCQRYEHYFCETCITKHFDNSQKCPVCQEELTVATLKPPSRMMMNVLSQLKVQRCKYFSRGCKELVKLEDVALHHDVCHFGPVVCSNEGCGAMVNKKYQASHEKENCEYRKLKCGECQEEMVYAVFKMHPCFMRQEMDEMRLSLTQIQQQQKINSDENEAIKLCLNEIQQQVKVNTESLGECMKNVPEMKLSMNEICKTNPGNTRKQPAANVNKPVPCILVAGGCGKGAAISFEIFNWATKTWANYEYGFLSPHYHSISFQYKDVIMVCGGTVSNKIECINMKENPPTTSVFPAVLPPVLPPVPLSSRSITGYSCKGAVCGNKVYTFYNCSVSSLSLDPPHRVDKLLELLEDRFGYGVEHVNNTIILVGGRVGKPGKHISKAQLVDTVVQYDIEKNTMQNLAPLPYKVADMATVCQNDDIYVLGGLIENAKRDKNDQDIYVLTNAALKYNIVRQEFEMLQTMSQPRSYGTAVIMDDIIVAIGGETIQPSQRRWPSKRDTTAEYYVLGDKSWIRLPDMWCGRVGATASLVM